MEKILVQNEYAALKVIQAGGKAQIVGELSEDVLIELGVAAIEKKYPSSAFLLEPLKAMIEAEINKV